MKPFLKNILIGLLALLWMGGSICGLVLAYGAKSLAAGISIVALSALAFPTIKKLVKGMNDAK